MDSGRVSIPFGTVWVWASNCSDTLHNRETVRVNTNVMRYDYPLLEPDKAQRRSSLRFPLRLELAYQLLGVAGDKCSGVGISENISATGILFSTQERPLPPDAPVLLTVDWPARRNRATKTALVAWGRVVRCLSGKAAVRILRHEFRTWRPARKSTEFAIDRWAGKSTMIAPVEIDSHPHAA